MKTIIHPNQLEEGKYYYIRNKAFKSGTRVVLCQRNMDYNKLYLWDGNLPVCADESYPQSFQQWDIMGPVQEPKWGQ